MAYKTRDSSWIIIYWYTMDHICVKSSIDRITSLVFLCLKIFIAEITSRLVRGGGGFQMKALPSDKTIAFFSIFLFVQYFRHKELGPHLKWAWLNASVLYGGPVKIIGFQCKIGPSLSNFSCMRKRTDARRYDFHGRPLIHPTIITGFCMISSVGCS